METRLWPTVDHLDPPDLPRHGCNSDRGPAASGGPTVLANDRNGWRLRLNASRDDDGAKIIEIGQDLTLLLTQVYCNVCMDHVYSDFFDDNNCILCCSMTGTKMAFLVLQLMVVVGVMFEQETVRGKELQRDVSEHLALYRQSESVFSQCST